jgi:uncharacterized protein (UPF0332 family)
MFYVAWALLLTRNIRRSKHSGVLASFNAAISREQASAGIAGAQRFVVAVTRRLAGRA